jgi:two-component SAPR family response regulator
MKRRDLRVTLIDDDEDDAFLFKEAISEINPKAEVKYFSNWKDTITNLQIPSNTPDIIFVDYMLPGKKGSDLLKDLRKFVHLKGTPIILCSGMNAFFSNEQIEFDQVITKPSTYKKLVTLLEEVFAKNLSFKYKELSH